ncbi:hypothetical protein P3L10_019443 [Capsicum annuum]
MFLHDKNMEQPFRLNWTTFSMGNKRANKVVFATIIFLRNDADEANSVPSWGRNPPNKHLKGASNANGGQNGGSTTFAKDCKDD